MGERRPLVVALGACGLDTIYRVPSSWQEGDASQKLLPTECVVVGEGMASSAAATVARLGGRAEIWGRVGDDGAGAQFSADMESSGVSTQHLRRVGGARTTISTILVSPDGERLVVPYCTRSSSLCVLPSLKRRGCADDPEMEAAADWLPLGSLAGRCSCVHADVRWPEGAAVLLTAARVAGIPAVLDADTAPAEALQRLVPLADYAIFSEPGLAIYIGHDGPMDAGSVDAALQRVAAESSGSSAGCAGVTLGEKGWRWVEWAEGDSSPRGHGPVQSSPSPEVTVVDTLAAGDVFHGSFALCIAEGGWTVRSAGLWAAAASALKCQRFGGRTGCPTREELEAFLATWEPWQAQQKAERGARL